MTAYSRYCEGKSLFIATKSPKPIGHVVKFKVALASGEHLMTGVGPVVETFDDRENRFSRPGMRVEVEKLDASGRHWMQQLRTGSGGAAGAPAVVSSSTGMFSTVTDDSLASAPVAAAASAAPAPAAPPAPEAPVVALAIVPVPVPVAPPVVAVASPAPPVVAVAPPVLPAVDQAVPSPIPVPVADNLSAGWELDGLPDPLSLPRPRSVTAPVAARSETNGEKIADRNGARPGEKNGEKKSERPGETNGEKPHAVVASGELDVPPLPPPLPPPPNKGRSKRITFPALMFNKPRGIAVPAPSGAVVPKPLALLPAAGAREGKLRPATAPIVREPAAPVAPLGTPSDTEPHAMVPPEIESALARSQAPAEGTPPPPAEPVAAVDNHPDITEAPPEVPELVAVEPSPIAPGKPAKRTKASTTTPPPVWTERTVTQTLHALVGGRPDPRVQEETIHWTNPGFAALTRPPTFPEVDIIEEEVSGPIDSSAVPLVVGVEITSDVMDKTLITPPPVRSRAGLVVVAMIGVAAACLAGGYYLGLRQAISIDKLPVAGVASAEAAPAADKQTWVVECAPPEETPTAVVAPAAAETAESVAPRSTAPADEAVDTTAAPEHSPTRVTAPEPALASTTSSPSSCYLNAMSSPVGAIVLVDNKSGGRTPLRTKVACGRHSVRFEMENYQSATRSVTVSRGETEKVSAELARPRAVLRVESTPSGATVLVNGSSVGLTPLTTTVPGFVSSSVTLSKPGYKTVARQINPTSTSARIGVTFKPDTTAARRSSSLRR